MCMKNVLIIGGNCDIGKYLSNYFLDKDYNVVVGYYKNDYRYDEKNWIFSSASARRRSCKSASNANIRFI